jgi:hypothetical protein
MQVQGESWLHTRTTFQATLISLLLTIGIIGLTALIYNIIVHLL